MNLFKSPFEKLSADNLGNITQATTVTAQTLSPGGALFLKIDEILQEIKKISKGGKSGGLFGKSKDEKGLDPKTLKLIGPAAQGIAEAFKMMIEALNLAPDGKVMQEKVNAVVNGMAAVMGMGKAIFQFAGLLALSLPLLAIGLIAVPLAFIVIMAVAGTFWLVQKMNIEKSIDTTARALVWGALAIVALGAAFTLFKLISPPVGEIFSIAAIVLGVGLMFWVLDKMGIETSMEKVSIGLMFAGLAIVVLGLSLAVFNAIAPPVAVVLPVMLAVLGISLVFALAGEFAVEIFEGALALGVAGIALIILAIGVTIMNYGMPDLARGIGMLFFIAGLAAVFGLIGMYEDGLITGIPLTITSGSIAVAFMGLSLIVLSLGVIPIAFAMKKLDFEDILKLGALIVGVGAAFSLAGIASPLIILGSVAMITASAAMITMAMGLGAMSLLFRGGKGSKSMFEDSGHKSEGFMGFGAGRMMSNLEWAFFSVANAFTLYPQQIASLYATAPAMIMAGFALVSIARGISKFQKLDIDYNTLPENIAKVTTVVADAFGKVGKKYPGGGGGFISAIFGSGKGTSFVAQGISAVSGMGRALGSIAAGVQHMADLKFPTKWDKDGNPIEFRSLTNEDFDAVTRNTQLIVGALSTTFGKIGASPNAKDDWGWFGHSKIEEGLQIVGDIGSAISELAAGLQGIADFKMPIYGKGKDALKIVGYQTLNGKAGVLDVAQKNIQSIVKALSTTFGRIGASPNAKDPWGWFGSSNIEEGISIVGGIGKAVTNLAQGLNGIASFKMPIYGTGKDAKKIVGYEQLSGAQMVKKASYNIRLIIKGLVGSFARVGEHYDIDDVEDALDMIEMVRKGLRHTTKMMNGIMKLDFDKAFDKVHDMGKLFMGKKGLMSLFKKVAGNSNNGDGGWWDTATGFVQDTTGFGTNDIEDGTKSIKQMLWGVHVMGKLVGAINKMDTTKARGNASDLSTIMNKMLGIYKKSGSNNWNAATLNVASKSFGKMADSMEDIAESTDDWVDSINSLDLAKVREVRKLYEGLAYLAGHKGETALEKMNQSLIDSLEHLADMLEKVAGQVKPEGGGGGGGDNPPKKPGQKPQTPGKGGDKGGNNGGKDIAVADAIKRLNTILDSGIKAYVTNF